MNDITLSSSLPLDQNPAAVYCASLMETGRRTQMQSLRVIASILKTDIESVNWGALRYQHTAMIRAKLSERYAPATANKILSALRQTLKQAWLLGQMSAEDYHRSAELEPVTGETIPTGRELSTDEIKSLLDNCKNDNKASGIRDAAIIALMYMTGLRREEVANLKMSDYKDGQFVVTGKRHKERTAYVVNGALDALNAWLSVRGSHPGKVFVKITKSGQLGKFLTPRAVYFILHKRGQEAGLQAFSPHDMRRTFISHLLEAGADISTVSKMAGHSNVNTTKRYDKRPEEAKRKAAELLSVPF